MSFFVPLVVDGALAGMVYALVALAFVLVYKASRMINFALGEWVMLGARLVATGVHALGLSLGGGVGLGVAGMVVLAVTFNRWVVRPLVARPLISLLMVTIGLGILIRGAVTRDLRGRAVADPAARPGLHRPFSASASRPRRSWPPPSPSCA